MKTFIIGKSERGKPTLTVQFKDLSFNVWRDLSRAAGHSYNRVEGDVFEFLVPAELDRGKQILIGAMFEEQK